MKKILIISYYFSPCTLTPSQRISYWGNNFYKLGFYPTIVTREWNDNVKTHRDTKLSLGNAIRNEKNEKFEVNYIPFKPGILDKAFLKWGESKFRIIFLLIKILDVLLVNFTLRFTSYANFLSFVIQLLNREKFDVVLISGEPFYLFKIGYLLNKLFEIDWIADYRDDWTTNELQRKKSKSFFRYFIFKVESIYERKWVSSSKAIISVSHLYTQRISQFLDITGYTIENGFESNLLVSWSSTLFDHFTVVYSGTLYPSQDISIILETLELAIEKNCGFKLIFLGSAFDSKEKYRIQKLIKPKLIPYVEYTERLRRDDALIYLSRCHLLLGIAYGDMKGIPSSKLYEYLALKKPVLLCPTDNDIMQNILQDAGVGFFANEPQMCLSIINEIKLKYDSGEILLFQNEIERKIEKYSRGSQMMNFNNIFNDFQ